MLRYFVHDENGNLVRICDDNSEAICTSISREEEQIVIQPPQSAATRILLDDNGYVDQIVTPAGRIHDFDINDQGLLSAYRSPNETAADISVDQCTRFEYTERGKLSAEIKGPENKTQTFDELEHAPWHDEFGNSGVAHQIVYSSAESEHKQLTAKTTDSAPYWNVAGTLMTTGFADGTESSVFIEEKGSFGLATRSDGTVVKTQSAMDPRFKDKVQYTSRYEVILPSDVPANPADIVSGNYTPSYVSTTSRDVTLADEDDLSSLLQYTETTTVNGSATSTNTYDATLRQWTYSSAVSGRNTRTQLDDKKRMSAMLWPDAVESDDIQLTPTYYGYDETLNQTNRITHGARETTYAFDANGRVGSMTDAEGRVHYYDYDADGLLIRELTEANSIIVKDVQYGYDANGNTIEKDVDGTVTSYTYDDLNRLISVNADGTLVSFEYDADGARVSKTVDGVTTEYLLDKNQRYHQVLEERTDSGALIAEYVYGNQRISMKRGGEERFYHYDGHGSTSELTDSAGLVTDEYSYEAFGNLIASSGIGINPFLYTGEAWDSETGMEYLRARYYVPGTGRFLNMDTHPGNNQVPLTLNKYLYGNGNPVMFVDPSGEFGTVSLAGIGFSIAVLGVLATTAIASYNNYMPKVINATLLTQEWEFKVDLSTSLAFIFGTFHMQTRIRAKYPKDGMTRTAKGYVLGASFGAVVGYGSGTSTNPFQGPEDGWKPFRTREPSGMGDFDGAEIILVSWLGAQIPGPGGGFGAVKFPEVSDEYISVSGVGLGGGVLVNLLTYNSGMHFIKGDFDDIGIRTDY